MFFNYNFLLYLFIDLGIWKPTIQYYDFYAQSLKGKGKKEEKEEGTKKNNTNDAKRNEKAKTGEKRKKGDLEEEVDEGAKVYKVKQIFPYVKVQGLVL